MTDDDWTIRVLEKLRKLASAGYMKGFVGWSYDTESGKGDENRALLRLETEKVITAWSDESGDFIPDKHGVLVTTEESFGAYDLTNGNIHKDAIVGNFNNTAFRDMCDRFGINADAESYRVELLLLDGVEPYIIVGQRRYRYRSLHSGKATDIIAFAYTKLGQPITQQILKAEAGIHSIDNVSQAIKDSPFVSNSSPLRLFTSANPRAITLSKYADATNEHLEEIKSKAIN